MTIRIFALILVASQTLALGASAMTHKRHHSAADREMSARSDAYFHRADRQPFAPDAQFSAPTANPADPPNNANGQ